MAIAYIPWTRNYAKQVIRRELMDPNAQWWSDAALNLWIDNWQNELQQDYELVWGSATVTTALNTFTLSSISPPMSRLDAVYFIGTNTGDRGYRLSGRLLQDLEVSNMQWRTALPDVPREVIQYDSTTAIVWPPLVSTGTFVFEYPLALSFVDDTTTISLPPWTQWSVKPYVCSKAYLQPGPVNDITKALRYKKLYEAEKSRIKLLWDNWLPERYRRLKPIGNYEKDIYKPPPAWSAPVVGPVSGPVSGYQSFIPTGTQDGSNTTFTLPLTPVSAMVFKNTLQLTGGGVDYTLTGPTIVFTVAPLATDLILVWTFA
jgi:hypothetical protein